MINIACCQIADVVMQPDPTFKFLFWVRIFKPAQHVALPLHQRLHKTGEGKKKGELKGICKMALSI